MPFVYSEQQLGIETGRNEWREIGSRLPAVMLQSSFYVRSGELEWEQGGRMGQSVVEFFG